MHTVVSATSVLRRSAVAVVVAVLVGVVAPVQVVSAAPLRPGQLVVVAGLGPPGFSGDGGPARKARITAGGISVGPDGSVYLSDRKRIRRVTPDGVIDTVFVAGVEPGGAGREAVTGATAGPDGSLYVTFDVDDTRQLRRIDQDGTDTVLADESELGPAGTDFDGDDVAVDGAGNAYLYNAAIKRVVRVDPAGGVTTVGDVGVDVTAARLAVAPDGTVYLAEHAASGPRRGGAVYAIGATGPLRTVATTGERLPSGPAVAGDGTVYFVDRGRQQIMRIGADAAAVPVSPALPGLIDSDLAVGPDGDLYVTYVETLTDTHQVLRLVQHGDPGEQDEQAEPARSAWADDAPGTVHTVAGSGVRPPAGEVTRPGAEERGPGGIAVGGDGTVYVSEPDRDQVLAIAPDGTVRRFAGLGTGDETDGEYEGVAAAEVALNNPVGLATAPDGAVYVTANGRLYRVAPDGTIDTVDTGIASGSPVLDAPRRVATDTTGTIYLADYQSVHRLAADGQRVLVAGYAPNATAEGAVPAHRELVRQPPGLAVGPDGSVSYLQKDDNAVRVARQDGTLGIVTGGRLAGFAGDGGPAARGALNAPSGVAIGPNGSHYIADTHNNRVRRVDTHGVISTVAGTGQHADTGDGGPASAAALTEPAGVAVGADGTLYVLTGSDLVRAIDPAGTIRTVADLHPTPTRRATDIPFGSLDSFAVGDDGTVYLASVTGVHRTRPGGDLLPVELDPALRTFDKYGPTSPPRSAPLTTGPDGSLYLVPNAVLRVRPDGSVVPLLGGGMNNRMTDRPPEDWSSRVEYTFREGDPEDIAVGPDGTLYLSTSDGLYAYDRDGTLTVLLKADDHDLLSGIALDPDGTPYVVKLLDGVYRVVDGTAEPFVRRATDQQPKFDAALDDPSDVAFTSDGVLFVSAGHEIRRFSPNGDIATVYRSDRSPVTQLDVGPGGDLYFLQPETDQVRVLVKAADAPPLPGGSGGSFPLNPVATVAIGMLLLSGLIVFVGARRRSPSATTADGRETST